MSGFVESDAKVLWFDVSVEELAVVDVLNYSDHLIDEHKHCFEGELAMSVFEEIFQGRPKHFHH